MSSSSSPESRYAALVEEFVGEPGVTVGSNDGSRRTFGASALKVNNKIFAMQSSRGQFVVKLPKARVDELVEGGIGERFDTGNGRVMREWFALDPAHLTELSALAEEALAYVRSQTQ